MRLARSTQRLWQGRQGAAAAVVAIHLWTLAVAVADAQRSALGESTNGSLIVSATTAGSAELPGVSPAQLAATDASTRATPPTVTAAAASTAAAAAAAAAHLSASSGSYILTDQAGVPCASVSCSFSLSVPYNTTTGRVSYYTLKPPCTGDPGVVVNGSCGKDHETLIISLTEMQWSITFDVKWANGSYFIDRVNLGYMLNETVFPNVTNPGSTVLFNSSRLRLFETTNGSYYSCKALVKTDLTHGYFLETHYFRFLAFTNTTDTTGIAVNMCGQDKPIAPDNTVPIAVGVSLAVLVVIIVISYFICRRTVRGYQSV